jgi:phosphoglycerate dehydrogenase-like enzyme
MGVNIVILDDIELTEAHYNRLKLLGTVFIHQTNPANETEIVNRLKDADVAILGWTSLRDNVLSQLVRLRLISIWATGCDYVDIQYARERGIIVTNVPAYAAASVAELTLGLMIVLARPILAAHNSVCAGDFSWKNFRGVELSGKTLGVVGVGDIGCEVARLGSCLGMHVLAHARTMTSERAAKLGVEFIPLITLLKASDFVSLHVPLSSTTTLLLGAAELAAMKRGAYLINTTRAGIIDQRALIEALKCGQLAGAALDEIHFPDEALVSLPNVILTPHIGFYTEEALARKGSICVDNVAAFLAGAPRNVVY